MKYMDFIKGAAIGMAAGAVVGAVCMPRKHNAKTTAGKVIKTAGRILNDVQDTMCI